MTTRLSKPRIFVAMPFGTKPDSAGAMVNFNAVYEQLFADALKARFSVFRADYEERAGNIATDMFQELLLADLVLVDISIDNPNVFYELGVRHTLRARGTLMVQGTRRRIPFDIGQERVFSYTLDDGEPRRPDPATLEADRTVLVQRVDALLQGWRGRVDSPVYDRLPALREPDWKSLKLGSLAEKWEELDRYAERIRIASRDGRPGDILMLAGEVPNRALEFEALRLAGKSLIGLGRFEFARQTLEEALALVPDDILARQQHAIAVGRGGDLPKAQTLVEALAEKDRSGETLGLLGRVHKDLWTGAWRPKDAPADADLADAARRQSGRLLDAVMAYVQAFLSAPSEYFPGINALTLSVLYGHLTGEEAAEADDLPPIEDLKAGVTWAVHAALRRERPKSYWTLASDAELALVGDARQPDVEKLYRRAVQSQGADWFGLDSTRQQVVLLRQLGFRAEVCDAVLALLDAEIARHPPPAGGTERTVLFAGHMLDNNRPEPRFPLARVDAAAARIGAELDALGLGAGDRVVSGAACGGDTLFLEAALARGAKAEVLLPKPRAEFLAESVSFAGPDWVARFEALERDQGCEFRVLPDEIGPPPEAPEGEKPVSAHARNTLWLLYTALSIRAERFRVLLLWDRKGGDGPGGTEHMAAEAKRITGLAPIVIDPAEL